MLWCTRCAGRRDPASSSWKASHTSRHAVCTHGSGDWSLVCGGSRSLTFAHRQNAARDGSPCVASGRNPCPESQAPLVPRTTRLRRSTDAASASSPQVASRVPPLPLSSSRRVVIIVSTSITFVISIPKHDRIVSTDRGSNIYTRLCADLLT